MDDGSHLDGPTSISLNVILLLVRPRRMVLVEDWSLGHWMDSIGQYYQHCSEEQSPLTKLILELVMFAATHRFAIANVLIDRSRAFITRGAADPPMPFNRGEGYSTGPWEMEFAMPVSAEVPKKELGAMLGHFHRERA